MEYLFFRKKTATDGHGDGSRIRAILDVRFGGGMRNPKWWEIMAVISVVGMAVMAFYLALCRLAVILEALK